ncbi:MAG TPA: hypothetical protein PLO56_14515 [Rhodothermales bacterium]|nr:hypothetical protein [Rhodothermales bacterium]
MYKFTFGFLTIASSITYFLGNGFFVLWPFISLASFSMVAFPMGCLALGLVFKWVIGSRNLFEDIGSTLTAFVYVLVGIGTGLGLFWSWKNNHTHLYIDNGSLNPISIQISDWETVQIPGRMLMAVSVPIRTVTLRHDTTSTQISIPKRSRVFYNPGRHNNYLKYHVVYGPAHENEEYPEEVLSRPLWFISDADFLFEQPDEDIEVWGIRPENVIRTVLTRVSDAYVALHRENQMRHRKPEL